MNVRHAHRPRRVTVPRAGASSVTAALPAITAAAAFIPGFGAHAAPVPAISAPDTSAPDVVMVRESSFRQVTTARVRADAALPAYRVREGDSISAVAWRRCGQARDWTGIFAASRERHLTGPDANVIRIGQQLAISRRYLPAELRYAPAPPPPPAPAVTTSTTTSSAIPVRSYHRIYHAVRRVYHAAISYASVSAGSSYERCVIARESGGNAQVMNSTGHYGLYQFDLGTWESGGGPAADFGRASAAEQQRVFRAVYAARGTQPWSPSDGC